MSLGLRILLMHVMVCHILVVCRVICSKMVGATLYVSCLV